MKTSIYLVRHGQTQWNREEIFRGTADVPLNDSGILEARLAGRALKDKPVRAVYTSPLARARQTAEAIAGFHGLEVAVLEGLKDLCFGKWQGVSHRTVRERYPELYRQWLERPDKVSFPEGESLGALQSRAVEAVKGLIPKHPEQTIVIVSHRVVNRALICGLVGIDLSRFWQIGQDTAAINLLTWRKGRFILTCLNDTCHLRELEGERVRVDF
ncbi:MAG: histidine phosphatase family protein [Deltaproteobacteria bacterium]|nr:histidine phosphatase family protein [Deltaproteobacteria bacterium]